MDEKPFTTAKWYNFSIWAPSLIAYALGLGVAQVEGAFIGILAILGGGALSVGVAIMVDRFARNK